jgi:hypothetical protein
MSEPTIKQKYKTYKRKYSDGSTERLIAVPHMNREVLYKESDTARAMPIGEVNRNPEGKAVPTYFNGDIPLRYKQLLSPEIRAAQAAERKAIAQAKSDATAKEITERIKLSITEATQPRKPITIEDWENALNEKMKKDRYKAKMAAKMAMREPESSSDEEVSSSEEESAPALPPPPPPIVEPDWGTDIPSEVRLENYTVRGNDYSVFKYRGDIFVYSDDATEFYGKFVMKNGKVLILDGKPIIDRGTSDPMGL